MEKDSARIVKNFRPPYKRKEDRSRTERQKDVTGGMKTDTGPRCAHAKPENHHEHTEHSHVAWTRAAIGTPSQASQLQDSHAGPTHRISAAPDCKQDGSTYGHRTL